MNRLFLFLCVIQYTVSAQTNLINYNFSSGNWKLFVMGTDEQPFSSKKNMYHDYVITDTNDIKYLFQDFVQKEDVYGRAFSHWPCIINLYREDSCVLSFVLAYMEVYILESNNGQMVGRYYHCNSELFKKKLKKFQAYKPILHTVYDRSVAIKFDSLMETKKFSELKWSYLNKEYFFWREFPGYLDVRFEFERKDPPINPLDSIREEKIRIYKEEQERVGNKNVSIPDSLTYDPLNKKEEKFHSKEIKKHSEFVDSVFAKASGNIIYKKLLVMASFEEKYKEIQHIRVFCTKENSIFFSEFKIVNPWSAYSVFPFQIYGMTKKEISEVFKTLE